MAETLNALTITQPSLLMLNKSNSDTIKRWPRNQTPISPKTNNTKQTGDENKENNWGIACLDVLSTF